MTEFKGTKGEWKYAVKGNKKLNIIVQIPIRETYNLELILGSISDDDCTVSTCCQIEAHSNAKLISCAPQMLEILIDIKDYLGSDKRQEVELLIKKITA